MKFLIDILLSTYNGQIYLPSLLDSLENQSNSSWKLIVRDDGSSDGSVDIIRSFQLKHPQIVTIVDDFRHCGPKGSFIELLKNNTAPYCMFCDQDDVWVKDKIKLTLDEMMRIETDPSVPCLVYSDLFVTDSTLNIIDNSFFKYQNINTNLDTMPYYVFYRNPAAGCTIMANRAACTACLPIGEKAIMHDWWFAICCCIKGKISCLNQPTALYRQHADNSIGAEHIFNFSLFRYFQRFLSIRHFLLTCKKHSDIIKQAKEACLHCNMPFSRFKYFFSLFWGKIMVPLLPFMIDSKTNRW